MLQSNSCAPKAEEQNLQGSCREPTALLPLGKAHGPAARVYQAAESALLCAQHAWLAQPRSPRTRDSLLRGRTLARSLVVLSATITRHRARSA